MQPARIIARAIGKDRIGRKAALLSQAKISAGFTSPGAATGFSHFS